MHTVTKGDITVMRVALALIERGERVLKPISENERYDIALDRGGALYRIQCKTGNLRDGCVRFKTCSSLAHRGGPTRDYTGQIEAFGVYCPQNGKTYLVPIDMVVGKRQQWLRVSPRKKTGGPTSLSAEQFELSGLVAQ